eukprot:INCI16588.1.p1 GENE.INCI16588.1~~INCI16588.1.p1  ORF type:complete len:567 (-),score=74.46 INCI16588.1:128-1759(-)
MAGLLAALGPQGLLGTALSPEPAFQPSSLLTPALKADFVRDGFVVVPGAIQESVRRAAVEAIKRSLAREAEAAGGGGGASSLPAIPKVLTSCPELTTSRTIVDLMVASQALGCVQALVGAPTNRPYFGQIALRKPGHGCLPPALVENPLVQMFLGLPPDARTDRVPMPFWENFWHIDGWPSPLNGNTVQNFTVLVGVMLSDAVLPNSGNLTVYPGSHRIIERVLRECGGPENIFTANSDAVPNETSAASKSQFGGVGTGQRADGHGIHAWLRQNWSGGGGKHGQGRGRGGFLQAWLQGGQNEQGASSPPSLQAIAASAARGDAQVRATDELRKRVHPQLGKPVQVAARAGDLVLAHYQLAHCIAPNTTENVRKCVYFRFTHSRRKPRSYCPEAMTNIWLEFEGLREQIAGIDNRQRSPTAIASSCASTSSAKPVPFTSPEVGLTPTSTISTGSRAAQSQPGFSGTVESGVSALEYGTALQQQGRNSEALAQFTKGVDILLQRIARDTSLSTHTRSQLRAVVARCLDKAERIKNSNSSTGSAVQ